MKKMHVLINSFSAKKGGGQTYIINLLNNTTEDHGVKITLLTSSKTKWNINSKFVEFYNVDFPVTNPILRFAWEFFSLPRLIKKLKPDILFFPGGIISLSNLSDCKVVTMFRNMMPFDNNLVAKYPVFSLMKFKLLILKNLMLKSMERADFVIFISNFARDVIFNYTKLGIKSDTVIPHGVGSQFKEIENDSENAKYIIYPSTFDLYKSQIEVVTGYGELYKRRNDIPKLVFVGSGQQSYMDKTIELVKELGLESKVEFWGNIDYTKMPEVYKSALIVVFASQTENCPNILLESLAAGKPIICSSHSPMPEFGGNAVVYVDPKNPLNISTEIEKLIDDPTQRSMLSLAAKERSELFSWGKTTSLTWTAIKNIFNTSEVSR